ncbi:MAG: tRNA pseudouridine(55) synthase TruB [Bifidobacteriaceae bacterium]|jgi:tRNA pseudouridine55 synthase|nr:tRNA pseudouridine(55) synthase TruB [Bifidobacteriaceae bacterium]
MSKPKSNPNINGCILIDKEIGWTSHDAVAKLRNLFHQRKAGHAGTLDPFASGLLIIAFGKSTKLLDRFQAGEKEYIATIQLGFSTTTDDLTGEKLENENEKDVQKKLSKISDENIRAQARAFLGFSCQTPSLFSAKKIDGVRAYKKARAGEKFELEKRPIFVYEFDILDIKREKNYINIEAKIVCSSGTYIRSIARDLGEKLEVGGHLQALRRTAIGKYSVKNAYKISSLMEKSINSEITDKVFSEISQDVEKPEAVKYGGTIGKFETMHKGHIAIIDYLVKRCLEKKLKPRVIIVGDENANKNAEREKILHSHGVQKIDYININSSIRNMDYLSFAKNYLSDKWNIKLLVMGEGTGFGKGTLGTAEKIKGLKLFEVETFELLPNISSTRIREHIEAGNFRSAEEMLGRKIDKLDMKVKKC